MTSFSHAAPAAEGSAPAAERPVPRGLPSPIAALHRRLADVADQLPSAPPSALLALALNRRLLPRLPQDAVDALQGRVVALEVRDFGLRVRLRLGPRGFAAAGDREPAALTIRACAEAYLALARGLEDPDRLFFERRLVMEGDTELGLVLKNTLDAIGPDWLPWRGGTR